jgi:hypothetical protein
MRRGFVGGGVIVAGVLVVAALVAVLIGQEWAVWPLIPLAIAEVTFAVMMIRRRNRGK